MFAHEWLCVGRGQPHPERRRLLHDARSTASRSSSPAPRTAPSARSRRSASTAACRWPTAPATARKFTCPYHHWSYGLDGRLLGAPAMERTEGFDKKDYPLPALAVELWQGFVFVNFDRDAAPLGADAGRATSRSSSNYDLEQRRLPRHVHAARPAVELEGDVRELQRRLPRQQAAPHHPGLLPERAGRVPRAVGRPTRTSSSAPTATPTSTAASTPRTKALLPVFPKLTEEERWRSTFALDAADAVLRHRARPGVLLHRAPEDGRHDRPRDRLPVPPERARAPDVRPPVRR